MEYESILIYASIFSVAVPIFLFILNIKKTEVKSLYILGILLGVSALADLTSYLLAMSGISNVPVLNLFFLIQFLLISWMYWGFYEKEKRDKSIIKEMTIIKIAVVIFVVVFIINTLFGQGLFVLQSYTNSVSSLLLFIFPFRLFPYLQNLPVKVPKKLGTPVVDVKYMTLYFINMAVLVYFGANFWLFTLSPPMLELFNEQGMFNLWACHNVVNIVKNLLFAGSLYYAGRKDLE